MHQRDVKGKKKSFYKYTGDKRKTRENAGILLSEMGDLVTPTWKRLRH